MMWRYDPNRPPPRKLAPHNARAWRRSYEHFLSFVEREGHAKVPKRHHEDGCALSAWVSRQRTKWREGQLLDEHRELLDRVPGWDWGQEGVAQMPEEEPSYYGGREWNFIHLIDSYRVMILHAHLLGEGAIPREKAIPMAIKGILGNEFVPDRHLRKGGRTVWLMERTIRIALRKREFDRPGPGLLRAVQRDAEWYMEDDWEQCIRRCYFSGTVTRDEVVRKAFASAVELFGLDLSSVSDEPDALPRFNKAIDLMIEAGQISVEPAADLQSPSTNE